RVPTGARLKGDTLKLEVYTRVRDGKDIKLSFYVRIFNAFHEYATEEEFGEMWKEVAALLF
ncbi:MAG: hypothetical protein ACLU9Z_00005, partial [Bacteroides intestinalis]